MSVPNEISSNLAKTTFAAIFAIALLYIPYEIYTLQIEQKAESIMQSLQAERQILGITTQRKKEELPVRLEIPSIHIDTFVEYVGITSKGAMDVPRNAGDVGWYSLGVRPGQNGSAVIAGHFDGENGKTGIFANLYTLKKGDKLYIKDEKGLSTTFIVRESRMYAPGYADTVFSGSSSAHLNLITCDGVWDGVKKSYTKRLVVFSDIAR
jgi:LPXTG-site transpeptidase (sortase) family protein